MRILLVIAGLVLASAAHAEQWKLVSGESQAALTFVHHQGVLIDETCKAKPSKCLAFQAYQSKIAVLRSNWTSSSSPAAAYCKQNKGSPLHLLNEANDEILVCAFEDLTLIDAWALYEHGAKK